MCDCVIREANGLFTVAGSYVMVVLTLFCYLIFRAFIFRCVGVRKRESEGRKDGGKQGDEKSRYILLMDLERWKNQIQRKRKRKKENKHVQTNKQSNGVAETGREMEKGLSRGRGEGEGGERRGKRECLSVSLVDF